MKISELSFNDIIPGNMRDDKTIKGFTKAFDHILDLYRDKVKLVTMFDNLDILSDAQLDIVARVIDIPWYDTSFDITVKRRLLRNYHEAYFKAGTPEGISATLSHIFGEAMVIPWNEYGGKPFHYKIAVDTTTDEERVRIAVRTIQRITPVVSQLDNIEKKLKAETSIYAICHAREMKQHRTVKCAALEG